MPINKDAKNGCLFVSENGQYFFAKRSDWTYGAFIIIITLAVWVISPLIYTLIGYMGYPFECNPIPFMEICTAQKDIIIQGSTLAYKQFFMSHQ